MIKIFMIIVSLVFVTNLKMKKDAWLSYLLNDDYFNRVGGVVREGSDIYNKLSYRVVYIQSALKPSFYWREDLVIDVPGLSKSEGKYIQICDLNKGKNQRFKLIPIDYTFVIFPQHYDKLNLYADGDRISQRKSYWDSVDKFVFRTAPGPAKEGMMGPFYIESYDKYGKLVATTGDNGDCGNRLILVDSNKQGRVDGYNKWYIYYV